MHGRLIRTGIGILVYTFVNSFDDLKYFARRSLSALLANEIASGLISMTDFR